MRVHDVRTLADFDRDLAAAHLRGQWTYDALLEACIGGPTPAGVPYLWRWEAMQARLAEACTVLPESFTARRNLSFINPALDRGTTHTLIMGMQMLNPGEVAWSHRHSIAALRFCIEGDPALVTVVDGEPCPMESYDLVLTPRWTWHDHENATAERVVWLDVLDIGLVLGLNVPFYEPYGEDRQPVREREADFLQARAGLCRPVWERRRERNFPFRYPWRAVEAQLLALRATEGSPYDGVALEYVNPMTGGPTLPTMSCWAQLLRPGEETSAHRHTSSAVYFVVRGEGVAAVGDVELEWGRHDAFVVPNWTRHRFVNRSRTEDAVLFSVHDTPALAALDLYFEEPERSLGRRPWPAVPADAAPRPR